MPVGRRLRIGSNGRIRPIPSSPNRSGGKTVTSSSGSAGQGHQWDEDAIERYRLDA